MSSSPLTEAPPTSGPFTRLVRTVSGRNTTLHQPAPGASTSTATTDESTTTPSTSTASSQTQAQRRKFSLTDKLRQFGGRSGKGKSKSTEESSGSSPPLSSPASPMLSTDLVSGHLRSITEDPFSSLPLSLSPSPSPSLPPNPDSTTLAENLRSLIDSLPTPTPPPPRPRKIPTKPPTSKRDSDGKPIPPPAPTVIQEKLMKLLSSATFMNGSKDQERPSVWSVLDGLGKPGGGGDGEDDGGGEGEAGEPTMEYPDNTSIMLTSPLIPTKDDLVELASSDFMPFTPSAYDTEATVVEEGEEEEQEKIPEAGWMDVWPLTMFMGAGSSARVESKPPARVGKQQQQRVWTPSKDKLSIEAMWWGYRIYLPPPVLLILSDRQLEATKRAALITTALTWFFNNLPVASLPLPLELGDD
ncbi:hypothetical protein BDN72DRAFT_965985 [Pluteus cervinus]|uniref:Uncharacterized protein n=1 Tax=Pluteus cervinus TaxID=181527 RepID=A0ACD3A1E4_9AGAR|nr:hypothetical protein BDN72DRAFT_965985 [Pluteus cervinus]